MNRSFSFTLSLNLMVTHWVSLALGDGQLLARWLRGNHLRLEDRLKLGLGVVDDYGGRLNCIVKLTI